MPHRPRASRPATALIIGPDESGPVFPGDALILVGEVDAAAGNPFRHDYNFGFSLPDGPGTAQIDIMDVTNILELVGELVGPSFAGSFLIEAGVPLIFPVIDTSSLPNSTPIS